MSENTALVKREVALTFDNMLALADMFAKSGRFPSDRTQAQAMVKILAGQEFGLGPFAAMSGINIIGAKAVMSYDTMGAIIKAKGKYNYRVKRIDNDCCEIEFFENIDGKWESIGVSKFDQEDAIAAESGKLVAPGHKASMLDRFPRNMLMARAMSNGFKWFCPDAGSGAPVYSQGEIKVIDVDFTPVTTTTTTTFVETVEDRILAMHSSGSSADDIAQQVGRPAVYVKGIIDNFSSKNEQERLGVEDGGMVDNKATE